jgi:transposase-like protein
MSEIGRPTLYQPEFAAKARELCEQGATDQELADFFEVSARTLYRWKNSHPDFCQALKASKEPADERVERSLFERATGYERDEMDIRVVGGKIVQTTVRKFYPPDTTAAIFWLKNRRPDLWRDKTDVEATLKGEIEHTHTVSASTWRLLADLSGIGANRQPAPPVPD